MMMFVGQLTSAWSLCLSAPSDILAGGALGRTARGGPR